MNREDIIRMAREAGLVHDEDDDSFFSPGNLGVDVHLRDLKRFAALVAAAEREECAKLCDEYSDGRHANMADIISEKIRARGQQ